MNLKEVSTEQLRVTRDAINGELDLRQAEEQAAAEAQILELAKANGVDLKKLAGVGGKPAVKSDRKTVQPKYCNPLDASQMWTGRGKPPAWAAKLKEANALESALIAPPSAPA